MCGHLRVSKGRAGQMCHVSVLPIPLAVTLVVAAHVLN